MDIKGDLAFGDSSSSRHDLYHLRCTATNNTQTCYVHNEKEFENGQVEAAAYVLGSQNQHRLSGADRGPWKCVFDSPKNYTATKMEISEPRVSESTGTGKCDDRTGTAESFRPRIQQHNSIRLEKPLSETVANKFRNVLFETPSDEDSSSVRNSFDVSRYLGGNRSSDVSSIRKYSPQSTTLSTSGVGMFSTNYDEVETMENCTKDDATSFKTIVKLRKKRPVNADAYSSWPSPQIHLMKRRSAEISELRQALEKKIRNQNCQYSRLSCNVDNYRDHKPEHFTVKSRPKSAFEYLLNREDDSVKENKSSSTQIPNSYVYNYNSRPVAALRQHNRNSMPLTSIDPRKLKYLTDDHRRSLLFDDQILEPILCQRCSNPVGFSSPPSHRKTSALYRDDGEDAESEYFTPQGSPESRIYQPLKKSRHKEDAEETPKDPTHPGYGKINYYPNCDATIWIRSCSKEVIQPISGVQSGVIPRWLHGALIRNGPGRIQVGEEQYNHLFDGSALLHRFHFRDGRVTYQNKFLESRSYLKDTQAQRIVVNYFGTRAHPDPCRTILQNIASKFTLEEHFTDNAQISLYPYGDGLYALTEMPFMYRVDPETLNTHDKVELTRYISVFTHTAHPHVDRDGTVYNIGQGVGPLGPRYHICKFPNTKTNSKGKVKSPFDQAHVVGSVQCRWVFNPCYMHSFAMTDNYWIIIEQPLVVSLTKIIKVLVKQEALIDALQWWEKETRIHVVRRDTGMVTCTQYVTETFFFLHTINAYEDRGHIILDISAYKNAEMLHCMFVEALKNAAYDPTYAQMFRGRPKRWVLPLLPNKDAGHHTNLITLPGTKCHARWVKKNVIYITPELLANIGCEVPRIYYEEYNGCFYRYFYAICSDVDHPNPGTLVKVNVVNKTHKEWSEDNVYPSEPIFVPAPSPKREDDGVILSALLRAKGLDQQVCLLILDAGSFTELGRVEFTAPGPVPKCLHGWFVPEGTLKVHTQAKRDKSASPRGMDSRN